MKTIFNLKVLTSLGLFVLLLTACKFANLGGSGSTSGGNNNSATTSGAFKPSGDARKDLGDAFRKLKAAYPYRLTETGSTSGTGAAQENTRVAEFAAADRSHVKLQGGAGGEMEEITIGEKQYWKQNGKWSENAAPGAAQRMKVGADVEKKLAEAIKDVSLVGPETVNGVPCYAYTYTLQFSGTTGTGKTWVGANDGLPHQSDTEFKYGAYGSKSHVVYDYNVKVSVAAPM